MKSNYPPACSEELYQHLKNNIQKFDIRTHHGSGLKHAAVAITIVEADNGEDAAIILTLRSSKLKTILDSGPFRAGELTQAKHPSKRP